MALPPLPSPTHLYSHPPPWAVNKSPPLLEHTRDSANAHRGSGSRSSHFLFTGVSFSGQHFKKADHSGMCLGVQQLGLSAFTAGDKGSILGRVTKIVQTTQLGKKKKVEHLVLHLFWLRKFGGPDHQLQIPPHPQHPHLSDLFCSLDLSYCTPQLTFRGRCLGVLELAEHALGFEPCSPV